MAKRDAVFMEQLRMEQLRQNGNRGEAVITTCNIRWAAPKPSGSECATYDRGAEVGLDLEMIVLDKRDEVRAFDVELLQPSDWVHVVVMEANGRPAAVKLVRKKKSKTLLRAPVQAWDDATSAVTVLNRTVYDIDEGEIKHRGKKIELDDLRESIGSGDAVLLEWGKKGELKKLRIVSNSERWAAHSNK